MVIVRSKLNQHWRGNRYEPGDKMPATEKQAQRLTESGQAYYDFDYSEEPNPEKKEPDFSVLPAGNILKNHFDSINGVSFASDEDLLAIDGIGKKTVIKIREYFD